MLAPLEISLHPRPIVLYINYMRDSPDACPNLRFGRKIGIQTLRLYQRYEQTSGLTCLGAGGSNPFRFTQGDSLKNHPHILAFKIEN